MQFFKTIPDNLFSVLSSTNKEIYLGSILTVFDEYEKGRIIGIERQEALRAITDFLDQSDFLKFNEEEDEEDDLKDLFIDEEENDKENNNNNKIKASYILRKLLQSGWVMDDILPDFSEYIIFPDYSITLITAIKNIIREEEMLETIDPSLYRGYVYTIYTLLTADNIQDYGITIDNVYNNTVLFYRELRKLDFKLRNYIDSILKNSELKDLMISLMSHKEEILDKVYLKLKVNENINKYKFTIIKKLTEILDNPAILNQVAEYYLSYANFNYDESYELSVLKINEVIDIFNSFEKIINEIDEKNKIYINTTIQKIKFLLNDDTDVIGQLTTILKYTKEQVKKGKTSQVLNTLSPMFKFFNNKLLSSDSLFTPRGYYRTKDLPSIMIDIDFDISQLEEDFYKQYQTDYTEEEVLKQVENILSDKQEIKASLIYDKNNFTEDDMILLLYIIVYSTYETNYEIDILDEKVTLGKYKFNDFIISRRQNNV